MWSGLTELGRERPGRFGATDGEERTFIDRATERLLAILSGKSADRRLVPKADDRPYVRVRYTTKRAASM